MLLRAQVDGDNSHECTQDVANLNIPSLAKATRQEMFSPIQYALARGEARGLYGHKRVLDHMESQNPISVHAKWRPSYFPPNRACRGEKSMQKRVRFW